MTKAPIVTGALLLLSACSTEKPESGPGAALVGATEAVAPLGSGWDDIDGSVVNYEYAGFGGFYLHFQDNKVAWQGYVGAFKGVTREVTPQVSKVADDIYFISWRTANGGGDNVVLDFADGTVYAHIGGDSDFELISGVIHCRDTPGCNRPAGESMQRMQVMQILTRNAREAGFDNLMEGMAARKGNGSRSPADEQGQAELTGKTLVYEAPEGTIRVSINGDETTSSLGSGELRTSATYATRIADGIWFISWDGRPAGNHVVFNSHNMRIYDQIRADGARKEVIYEASCFSDQGC